ncbi:hypothetical protein CB0940_05647 [Cercospora beticola]|uniref:Ketopantoate reductase N-terminal domain-containing protein n=1 Tax=Cercospora beticola TaxID=122368 RepID=A0A2G5I0S0_CERBT|nr:hypothetical protein CB0940_05647 [Cercospora beticola]PIA98123.1 hypothetical protein CB0940_05647 [Cercospora beticola]WPA98216.1 hypothetical protein RHO25_002828 [Cercospora beticola]CAK1359439.1 unnamed protein product [Cercospora beticola]
MSQPPLNIAILGVGRIGSTIAFQLSQIGNHKITGIARPKSKRLEQLRQDDGILNTKNQKAQITTLDHLNPQIPYDLIIVTPLAHQAQPLLPVLQQSSAKCILFMFNTFTPENLINTIGHERTAFGMSFFQANLKPDGRLESKITGPGTQRTVLSDPRWVELFTSSGLPAEFEPNMPLWLRCHTPMTIALEKTMAKGHQRGSGVSWGEAMDMANGIRDCFALIRKLGYEVYPNGKRRVDACPKWIVAFGFWFLSRLRNLRELFVTGTPECDAIMDAMAEVAEHAGLQKEAERVRALKPMRGDPLRVKHG